MADEVRDAIAADLATLGDPVARTPETADGFGVDLICVDDLSPTLKETKLDSTEDLFQTAWHHLSTARGSVPDAPDFGIDVISWLHRGTTVQDLEAMAGEAKGEILKDDRIATAVITVTASGGVGGAKKLSINARLTPEDPTLTEFDLIITLTNGAAHLEALRRG